MGDKTENAVDVNERTPRVGAIIRAHVSDSTLANPAEFKIRSANLKSLVNVLSSVNGITTISLAFPNLPSDRRLDAKSFRPAKIFYGDEHDISGRMIACARRERIDVIVDLSDQFHFDRTKPARISAMIRHHFSTRSDYTEPEGFAINTFPRLVNRSVLEKIHHARPRWPYYHHLHLVKGLRIERFSFGAPDIPPVDAEWIEQHARYPLERKELSCLQVLEQTGSENGSILYNLGVYCRLIQLMKRHAIHEHVVRKPVMEIGGGHFGGAALFFYLLGARRVYAIDIESSTRISKTTRAILQHALSRYGKTLFPMIFPDHVDLIAKNLHAMNHPRFLKRFRQMSPCDAKDLPIPANSVGFSFSLAVLEHVDDPQCVIREQFRVLKPGGIAIHSIGLLDHKHMEKKPLEFLKYPKGEFEIGHTYCNKWRASDFTRTFKAAGFRIRKTVVDLRTTMIGRLRKGLHGDFRHYSDNDLSILAVTIVAEKPWGSKAERR